MLAVFNRSAHPCSQVQPLPHRGAPYRVVSTRCIFGSGGQRTEALATDYGCRGSTSRRMFFRPRGFVAQWLRTRFRFFFSCVSVCFVFFPEKTFSASFSIHQLCGVPIAHWLSTSVRQTALQHSFMLPSSFVLVCFQTCTLLQ